MIKKYAVGINTIEIAQTAGEVPEWVPLIPAGEVVGRDGRTWINDKPEVILESFSELDRDLPIDIEHSTEHKAPKGEPAPAVAWIKELENRDGEIWGKTEWNATGKQLVGEQAYRYLSPVILYQPSSGTIVGLTSVAVTNQPNFKLSALNHQGGDQLQEENVMLKALLAALALPENATEAEAVAKIQVLNSDLATANNRAANPSLETFVPRADYDTALNRATVAETAIAAIKKETLEADVEYALNQALNYGKITPATKEYHKAQCMQEGGLALFTAFCSAAPVIGDDSDLNKKDPEDGKKSLNAQEKQICENLAISEEDYLKTK